MANYVICNKHLLSKGMSELKGESHIKLADIHIRTVTCDIDNQIIDRTNFLKYGQTFEPTSYHITQNEKDIKTIEIILTDIIQIKTENEKGYYFNFLDTNNDIKEGDVISMFCSSNNDLEFYCYITSVEDDSVSEKKFYIDYYSNKSSVDFLSVDFSVLRIFKYTNIQEETAIYELSVFNDGSDIIENSVVPIFLPIMNRNSGTNKKVILHVDNTIPKFKFIFITRNTYLQKNHINGLTSSKIFIIEHEGDLDCSSNIISFLYNGKNSWFVI